MWMMPLHLHVNQKYDYDDDDGPNCWLSAMKTIAQPSFGKMLHVIIILRLNGKSMLHPNYMHIFRPRHKHLRSFKKIRVKL